MIKAGEEVAYAQFMIVTKATNLSHRWGTNVLVEKKDGDYLIKGEDVQFVINGKTGILEDYMYQGSLLLSRGPKPEFSRALLDNDPEDVFYESLEDSLALCKPPVIDKDEKGRQRIRTEHTVSDGTETGVIKMCYCIEDTGAITVTVTYDLSDFERLEFVRVGTGMVMPEGFEEITWYGNGDGESFSDRKSFARISQYTARIEDMYYPFMVPQDCGGLTDVRWISIKARECETPGLLVVGKKPFYASALHHHTRDLNEAKHVYELKPSKETFLRVDGVVAGTGNASCGDRALAPYRVKDKICEYTFTLLPAKKDDDIMSLWKIYKE